MCRRLAMLLGEGTSRQASSQALEIATSAPAPAPKKMIPKKAKRNLHLSHVSLLLVLMRCECFFLCENLFVLIYVTS
jgi:hypothetical protein